jgi:hypothetical protein
MCVKSKTGRRKRSEAEGLEYLYLPNGWDGWDVASQMSPLSYSHTNISWGREGGRRAPATVGVHGKVLKIYIYPVRMYVQGPFSDGHDDRNLCLHWSYSNYLLAMRDGEETAEGWALDYSFKRLPNQIWNSCNSSWLLYIFAQTCSIPHRLEVRVEMQIFTNYETPIVHRRVSARKNNPKFQVSISLSTYSLLCDTVKETVAPIWRKLNLLLTCRPELPTKLLFSVKKIWSPL